MKSLNWLDYAPQKYGCWDQSVCPSPLENICVNLSGSDFLACSLIPVE